MGLVIGRENTCHLTNQSDGKKALAEHNYIHPHFNILTMSTITTIKVIIVPPN